ncbi:MAG: hypothetical protein LC117_10230 [Bacteroidia bacterium]|nr:hypothetical protein [Bacteroidia bacterium]
MVQSDTPSFPNISLLNQEKYLIRFVYSELEKSFSAEKLEITKEIFEYLRTSVGINLAALTKVRIRRLKPAETRAFLTELDKKIRSILDSKEFNMLLSGMGSSVQLYDKIMRIKTHLNAGNLLESEKETHEFRNLVANASTGDMMIAFFRLFNPEIKVRQPNPEIKLKGIKLKNNS